MSVPDLRFGDRAAADVFLASLNTTAVAGVDEVGKGPLAGPVVVACVLLPPDHKIVGIKDSKQLSAKRRQVLADQIMECSCWGIGSRDNLAVDQLNIHRATKQAAADAVWECIAKGASIRHLLCDGGLGLQEYVPFPSHAIIKGDNWFECIGAASIIAKVFRDNQMAVYHELWPEYRFCGNQGYGTKNHIEAILKYGMTPIHRRSFGVCRGAKERKVE